jgi:lipopolysaccharide export system permease protein
MAQMKLLRIMYSIRQTAPESDTPEKIFYNKINGYNIYVEKKNNETGMLYNVTIYDMSAGFEKANILVSDSAIINNTTDEKHMILSMFSGEQFSNLDEQNINKKNAPYRRETFLRKDLVIETEGGFEMKDADFLKSKADGKNMKELVVAIDSLSLSNDSIGRSNLRRIKRTNYRHKLEMDKSDSAMMARENTYRMNVDSLYSTSTNKSKLMWKREALRNIANLKNNYDVNGKILHQLDKDLNKHKIYWWEKITLSLGCLVFLLIGAPLGSIVRKGGLGYPVVISVATFILYYIFETSGSKMASEGEWKIWIGAWLSTMVLLPTGLFFTYQANKDSGIMKNDTIKEFFKKLFIISEKRNITIKDIIINAPDYKKCYSILEDIYNKTHKYRKENRIKGVLSIKKIFFNENDYSICELNDRLEYVIEELSNSNKRKIIIILNELPILRPKTISSPFKKRWQNVLLFILLPISLMVYIRSIRGKIKLATDLTKVEAKTRQIMHYINQENL